jgi:dTDP-4-dehydrorhamnose 3,5-epimerase
MKADPLVTAAGQSVAGPLLITPDVYGDTRGYFLESWNACRWGALLETQGQQAQPFVQDNHSRSSRGVLRGLHWQIPPQPQGKLVRCVLGEIFDVAVDLRRSSATFGQWVGARLSASNHHQLWVPVGFAHGFLTLSDHAEVLYKTTAFWDRDCERSLHWNDPHLAIAWPTEALAATRIELSAKDTVAPQLHTIDNRDLFA